MFARGTSCQDMLRRVTAAHCNTPVRSADAVIHNVSVGSFAHGASKGHAAVVAFQPRWGSWWMELLGIGPLLDAGEAEPVEARIQVGFVLQLNVVETNRAVHAA